MVEIGKKVYPGKKKLGVEKGDNFIKGPYWSISVMDGEYVFEYISGSHGGSIKRAVISKIDFDAVHSDRMSEYDLALKYNLN